MNKTLPLIIGLTGLACTNDPQESVTRAYQIVSQDQAIGGPKALAQVGDYIIENDRIRIAILGDRISMGPHTSGASIIDADLQRNDPRYSSGWGNDQLAELFPTVNLNVQRAHGDGEDDGTVQILNDGSDGSPAVICTEGPETSFISLMDALWNFSWIASRPFFRMRTDYTLSSGSGAIHIRTTAIFSDSGGCDVPIESVQAGYSDEQIDVLSLALETGLVMGDFYLQGGSVDVFVPGVGFDEDVYLKEYQESGGNTFVEPIRMEFIGGAGDGVSYGLMPDQGAMYIPMFTSSQTVAVAGATPGNGTNARFESGTAIHYDRWFGIGNGDIGSVYDVLTESGQRPVGTVTGHVLEEHTGAPLSGVHVFAFEPGSERPFMQWTTDGGLDTTPDGSFAGSLPPGDWELLVHANDRPPSGRTAVHVECDADSQVLLSSPRPGFVRVEVVDETDLPVPAKITFFPTDPTPRATPLGQGHIAGNPATVEFTAHGTADIWLPPGEYTAVASRGFEYEIHESEPFTVTETSNHNIDLQVIRSVDTSGWVGADFHVHGQASHDSGTSLSTRVLTMASEGVEFLSSTDHDYLTNYAPTILDLGLDPWLSSTVGAEVTTIEIGHFLGFPLQVDYLADANGALAWDDLSPDEIIDGLRALGSSTPRVDPVVFIGHPRDGILGYFDQYGLNHFESEAGDVLAESGLMQQVSGNSLLDPSLFSMNFDAMEVLCCKRFEQVRTPTVAEVTAYGDESESVSIYDMLVRTSDEQQALRDGEAYLSADSLGALDDWFNLNNLGYTKTALGNSDTHGTTSIESGCPRNFVQADTDDPAFLDADQIAEAVREGRVVASYGPFIRFFLDEEKYGPGSEVAWTEGSQLHIEVQSPSWFDVERVELYENGALIEEWSGLAPNDDVVNLDVDYTPSPSVDSWYVAIAIGSRDSDLAPVCTTVEVPPIQLEDIVMGALGNTTLGGVLPVPTDLPRAFPIHPYAVTNPIRIDLAGDGWEPPGLPEWLAEPPSTD